MAKLEVKGKKYEFKFDYLAIRKFSKIVGLKHPSDLEGFFSKMDLENPSFDDIDNIIHLVRSAIKHIKVPTFENVLESVMADPEGMAKIFEEFNETSSVEVTEEEGKEGN